MPTFYGAIDLSKNELRNAIVQNLGSAPASPLKGQIYMDTSTNLLYFYNGTAWIAASGATISGTVTTLAIGGAAVPGVATAASAGDHAHGMPAFVGIVTAETTYGLPSSVGSATTLARGDHTHGSPNLTAVPPVTQAIGDVATLGGATAPSLSDHRHGMPSFGTVTQESTFGSAAGNGVTALIARTDHTHGNPTHGAPDHTTIPLSTFAVPTTFVNMSNQQLLNLPNPVNPGDAANKFYVDNLTAGLSWKEAVRAASAVGVNVPTLSGLIAIDGVTVAAGDRVLLKDQTAAAQNGIYVAAAGAWARSTDATTGAQIVGMSVFVEEGTTMSDSAWVCTTNAPITVGTTPLAFAQFAGGGTVTAGAGMTQSGNVLNVIAGDTSLTVNPDELHVNTGVIATVASLASYVPTSRQVIAGTGLTGGGALSADATLNVIAGDTTLTVAADSVVVNTGVIATVASVTAATTGMAKKYATALAGTASPETITHNLNTQDVMVMVHNSATPYSFVQVDWTCPTVNTVVVSYNPNLGAGYRVVVIG